MDRFDTHHLTWDGTDRRYRVWYSRRARTPRPIMIVLAGGDQSGRQVADQFGLRPGSPGFERRPFVVVVPESLVGQGGFRCWNSGHFPGAVHDDAGFIGAAVAEVRARLADRIDGVTHAIGFSNGGMMAYRLAADPDHDLRAIGVVGGVAGGTVLGAGDVLNGPDAASAPVSVFHVHAVDDAAILAGGGVSRLRDRFDVSVFESIRPWLDGNGCQREPRVSSAAAGTGMRLAWSGREGSEVVLELITGGHVVPDGAMDAFARFFRTHSG